MKFEFELQPNPNVAYTKEDIATVRCMMLSFETMINASIPRIRVHLKER